MPDIFNIATVVSGSVPLLKAGHSDRKLTSINDLDLPAIDPIINVAIS